MGLDMSIMKIRRFKDATLKDVWAVESYIELQEYKKKNPDCRYTMKQWCGMNKPSKEFIDFYSPLRKADKYGFERIFEEVAYWRKANAIHNWFVKNVQDDEDDCNPHRELTRGDLETLRKTCNDVLRDLDRAEELLPTQSGFFFGSTEYDKHYVSNLIDTIDQIDKILKETDFNTEALYYVSSW